MNQQEGIGDINPCCFNMKTDSFLSRNRNRTVIDTQQFIDGFVTWPLIVHLLPINKRYIFD